MKKLLFTMVVSVFLFLISFLQSCCLGNYKCNQDNYNTAFRILAAGSSTDLVFGAGKIYNKDSILFFSLNAGDTIYHYYGASHNSQPGQDSLLYVSFDYRKFETVFIRLNSADSDTLKLAYNLTDGSPCCPDFRTAEPLTNNNNSLEKLTGGITVIRK